VTLHSFIILPSSFCLTEIMASILTNNAIGSAQFHLNGGWRNTLTVVCGYAVVIGGLIVVTASLNPSEARTILSGWTKGLLVLQIAALVVYASHRIITGIRRDLGGQMIESHRLMPIPPLHAVVGYVFGAASQSIWLAVVNFSLGGFTTQFASLPAQYWLLANVVIATFAVFVWAIVAAVALTSRGALFWVIGPLLVYLISGAALARVVPGLSVLATPTQGVSVFDARLASRPPELYAVPLLCQGMIGVLCLVAAVRKYRRSEDAALGPLLSLALLAAVVIVCAIGIRWEGDFGPSYLYGSGNAARQLIASTYVVLLFATVAACALAWADALAKRQAARRNIPPTVRRRTIPPVIGLLLAAGIAASLAWSAPTGAVEPATVSRYTAGIVLAHGLAICYLARWMYARVDRAALVVIIWIAVVWLAPLVIDIVVRVARDGSEDLGTLGTLSPIGTLIAVVHPDEADPRIGLLGQFALALLTFALYRFDRSRSGAGQQP